MNKSGLMLASAAFCTLFCINAEAKLYKWVDEKGVTHYGETVPPEYANSEKMKLEKGRIEKVERNKPAEDKNAQSNKDKPGKLQDNQATLDARRHDNALLNSYSNEKEIDLARDRNLSQIEARIGSYTTLLKSAHETVDQLHQESDNRTKVGKKIPQSLTDDIAAAEARVDKLQNDLDTNVKESETVKARYEADKQRFRELKGLSPTSR
jgi:Domain of unknown function (DUF4124)